MSHFPQGSIWRRWDLHVHTPASIPSDFGNGWEDDTWDKWTGAMVSALRSHEIHALGLADYFTVDGYAELVGRGLYDPDARVLRVDGEEEAVVILPGLELRLSHITHDGHAINVHVIFDPSRLPVSRIRDDFLSQLPLDPPQGNQDLKATKEHLLALGRAAPTGADPNLNEDFSRLSDAERHALLLEAHKKAAVSLKSLRERLQALDHSVPGGRCYLLAVAKTGHGSLAELPWDGQAANIKKVLMKEADLLFSSNPNDRAFLLGEKDGHPPALVEEQFGSLKACVWGSDCHDLDNLLHPSAGNTRRYCWVKADLTFEGLKQVLYEPADRAIVQESNPDQRPWTEVISRVRFLDVGGDDHVGEEWIPLNPRLSTIIGGKSAGKSLLLYMVARTIDPTQAKLRLGVGDEFVYGDLEASIGFEVEWRNGDVQRLGAGDPAPSRITYLPQNYINRLAEPDSQGQLEDVILRLLKEDEEFAASESELQSKIDLLTKQLTSKLQRLHEMRRQLAELTESVQDLGNEEAIESEIARLERELDEIRVAANMSDEEAAEFAALRDARNGVERDVQTAQARLRLVVDFEREVQSVSRSVLAEISSLLASFIDEPIEGGADDPLRLILSDLVEGSQSSFEDALQSIGAERERVREEIAVAEHRLSEIDDALKPFQAKLESRERADSLEEAQKRQRESLTAIRDQMKRLAAAEKRLDQARAQVLSQYRALYDSYQEFVDAHLGEDTRRIAPDVELLAGVSFDEGAFATQILDGLDGRQRLDDKIEGFEYGGGNYRFRDIESHMGTVAKLLRDFTNDEATRGVKLRKSYGPSDMTTRLLRNHFRVRLSLRHGGDDLPQMSPGKRGMVLLRLLLERSDASHPILIDQPEDNLDNRTVFSELKGAVKSRKKARQIVMVTHNANLVVSTDSEVVLVAHQYGPGEQPADHPRFDYRGGSLEHSHGPVDSVRVLDRQGTKEHVCEVLEGGAEAFVSRQRKYEFGPG